MPRLSARGVDGPDWSPWPPWAEVTQRRPKPPSLRQKATWLPSGDQAKLRWPGPQGGSPCSASSGTIGVASDPSGRARHTLSQPPASHTKASAVPSGENRGWPTPASGTPTGTAVGTPRPSEGATVIRLASQGMAGPSHSCQATRRPSGDHAGSKAKSGACSWPPGPAGPADRRTGHEPPSTSDATATWRPSRTYATWRPSGETAGAETAASPTTCRGGPPATGCQ